MSRIIVSCPGCGKPIQIDIKTIDKLSQQVASLKADRDYYKRKLAALELMNSSDAMNIFSEMFGEK